MFNVVKKELEWGGRTLTLETGRIARQSDAAVVVTYGETTILATAVAARTAKPNIDFFPLTIHYQEKFSATGKIPGGYGKREGRASEKETLVSRLIDRPIRPLFFDGFKNEVQVVVTLLSHDLENDSDIPAIIGASAALTLAGYPFMGPIGAAKVGFKNGQYILNPKISQIKTESDLELIIAGTADAVMMVESEAKELTEEEMLGAVNFGHNQMQPVIETIIEMAEEAGKAPWDLPADLDEKIIRQVAEICESDLREAFGITDKQQRSTRLGEIKASLKVTAAEHYGEDYNETSVLDAFKKIEQQIVRGQILNTGKRIDGRDTTTVRPIVCETGILPRVHGSALFTRGETQALVVATLGTEDDQLMVDAIEGMYREPFMLHYNFPPYSVGECGRMGAPGRREIGHGKLAWRSVKPMLPTQEQFPYTIRLLSEITESNGSSSMATVCGSSLALMDAGVPLPRPIAGIAMGLIKEEDRFAVLTDILGDEDHLGDMDFKVAGTDQGITSLQMDIKISGITSDIMQQALLQAKDARIHILGEMATAITSANNFSPNAPKIEVIKINVDKIRDIIGTGGKVIRDIVEKSGAKIDIADDGTVKIASNDQNAIAIARQRIEDITAEPEVGKVYDGKVVKVVDFGVFVNFMGARDGLVHVSMMADYRVKSPSDICKEGDAVKVKVLGFDDRGKIRLSMKDAAEEG
ncbi:MAG: polyribonucleotide nucleotidyltransferase [Dasania sp.]|jgi:polyribonucleotide nucleotidyltransferase